MIYLTYNTYIHWHCNYEMLFVRGYGFTSSLNITNRNINSTFRYWAKK